MSDELLHQLIDKLSTIETRIDNMYANMATKDDIATLNVKFDIMTSDFARMEKKLDATFEQVAHNTEFEATVMELAATVEENTTDIKLLKKLVANF